MVEVLFAEAAETDLRDVFSYLAATHEQFGQPPGEAARKAAERVGIVQREVAKRLAKQPFSGTRREDLLAGLRFVPVGRATAYFQVDDATDTVTVLAIFYGGQDHEAHMLARLCG